MTEEKHMYVIPTNRDSHDSIDSLVNDVKLTLAEKKLHHNQIEFVILDSGTDVDFQLNHQQLIHSIKGLKLNAYHIPSKNLDYILKDVLDSDLSELIVGEGFSYGKMVNKISIIANILHAKYIHRRDSDVYIQKHNTKITPLIAEIQAFNTNEQCIMVGSSYTGAWGIDYSDVENDIVTLRKLFSLSKPSYTVKQLDDYINNKYIAGSKETFSGSLILSESKANYIDAGNFSLRDIFQYLPVSPADITSGTDYLYHTVLGKSDWKIFYHNNRVIHKYTSDRYDRINHIIYGDSKLLSRLMTTVTQNALTDVMLSNNFREMAAQLANSYSNAVKANDIKSKLRSTLDSFIDVYSTIPYENYKKVASHVAQNKEHYIDKTIQDVNNFVLLINNWENVMKKTSTLSISDFLISEV